jgi:hypothetical protein
MAFLLARMDGRVRRLDSALICRMDPWPAPARAADRCVSHIAVSRRESTVKP